MRNRRGVSVTLARIKRVTKPSGISYYWHRAPGGKLTKLPGEPGDPDFLAAYALAERKIGKAPVVAKNGLPALCNEYLRSRAFKSLSENTRLARRRIALDIADRREKAIVAKIRADHIEMDLRDMSPQTARARLQVWRSLLEFAKSEKWVIENVAKLVPYPKINERRHEAWTSDDVEAFRARWPHGTTQRLAFELLYWTGCRRSDVVRLGPLNVRGGKIRWTPKKGDETGQPKPVEIPVAAELANALTFADPGCMTFLDTSSGKPRTAKGFGEWFATACKAAGVSARAHGIRHTFGSDAAEEGASNKWIGSALGHASDAEAETYTAQASRARMASAAVKRLEKRRSR